MAQRSSVPKAIVAEGAAILDWIGGDIDCVDKCASLGTFFRLGAIGVNLSVTRALWTTARGASRHVHWIVLDVRFFNRAWISSSYFCFRFCRLAINYENIESMISET
jgi:hypothetical protein